MMTRGSYRRTELLTTTLPSASARSPAIRPLSAPQPVQGRLCVASTCRVMARTSEVSTQRRQEVHSLVATTFGRRDQHEGGGQVCVQVHMLRASSILCAPS